MLRGRQLSFRSLLWLIALGAAGIAAACAEGSRGDDDDDDDAAGGGSTTQTGTGSATSTGTNSGTATGTNAGTATATSGGQGTGTGTAGSGASGTGGSGAGSSSMDPLLDLPNPTGASCSPPGTGYCAGIEICRISGPNSGTCESCSPCGNLHDYCTQSSECDILFQCYSNTCVAICDFNTPQTCGVPNCLDVGHATHGVCWPP